MSPIRYILRYALPYKGYIALNMLFNVLYAIFNALSLVTLMPMLEVLFGEQKFPTEKPAWDSELSMQDWAFDSFRYMAGQYAHRYGCFLPDLTGLARRSPAPTSRLAT